MRVRRVRGVVGGGVGGVGGVGVVGAVRGRGVRRALLQVHERGEQARVGLVQRGDAVLLRLDDALLVRQRGRHLALLAPQLLFHAN